MKWPTQPPPTTAYVVWFHSMEAGMRIKLAEAWPLAAHCHHLQGDGRHGLDLRKEVIVAEDPMAEALTHLLTHGEEAKALGARGRAWALQPRSPSKGRP